MSLVVTNAWPETLPLPSLDYQGTNTAPTLISAPGKMANLRRSRFEKNYPTLQVEWVLNDDQLVIFKSFFKEDLGNGIAHFSIELRYPKNSDLDEWSVRFVGGYQTIHEEGLWRVQASLLVINPVDM